MAFCHTAWTQAQRYPRPLAPPMKGAGCDQRRRSWTRPHARLATSEIHVTKTLNCDQAPGTPEAETPRTATEYHFPTSHLRPVA